MLTKEQIETLRAAGISESAIIDRILQDSQEAPVDPAPAPAPAPAKADPAPAPAEPAPEEPKETPGTDKILQAIENLTGVILGHNVLGTGSESAGPESVDQILTDAFYKGVS